MSLINAKGLQDADGDTSFPTIPAGKYRFRVTKVEDKVTKSLEENPDAKYPSCASWSFTCRVQSDDEAEAKVTLFNYCILPHTDMAPDQYQWCLNNLKHFMLACAVESEGDEIDSADFMGCEFDGMVIERTGTDGKPRNELKDTMPVED